MQKLIRGLNSIEEIGNILKEEGYQTVYLITGKHFVNENKLGFLDGLNYVHYIKQGANVDREEVDLVYKEFSLDNQSVLLAIGGGSVIDLAKAVLFYTMQSSVRAPYFIAVPTTTGSGTEATHFAVMYENKKKQSLQHPDLLPRMVILDPLLTISLSPYQAAVSGMDAFCQAVESYWNLNANAESRSNSLSAILLWRQHFLASLHDSAHREGMLDAAYLSVKAINLTRTTGPHALSYYLTAHHNIPHGQAVALFLPVFFLYNDIPPGLLESLQVRNSSEASQFIRSVMQQAGLAVSFKELNIVKEEIVDTLLEEVNEERFANNPASFDKPRLRKMILEQL